MKMTLNMSKRNALDQPPEWPMTQVDPEVQQGAVHYGMDALHRPASLAAMLLDPGFPYGEELLQFIWEQGLYEQHALRTVDGRALDVIRPGRIQTDSGPDLVGAQVRIGGQLWGGTVEVHLRSSDWNAHGHQHDPAYDNVVLHVVYEHDAEVRNQRGVILPTVELISRVSTEHITAHRKLMCGQGFVPCASQLPTMDHLLTGPWLERVLVERLERKTAEVETRYRQLEGDPSATLYHMLARAFGFKVNAEPFSMLAHALPLRILRRYHDDALRTEALLFGQAGLLQVDLVDEHPRVLQREHALLARMHGLRSVPVAAWKFGRMRPFNLPTVRIAQLAQLTMRCEGTFAQLLQAPDVERIQQLLDVEAGPYWTTHYLFDRESAPVPKRLGGQGARHLIINALVPTLFALGRLHGDQALCERAMTLLEQLPPERNQVLEGWAGLGLRADTAARGQALLELRTAYCTAHRCLSCGIGNQLLRRNVHLSY
jgi:hypothetical protein